MVNESSSTQVMETRSYHDKAGPSRNVEEVIGTVLYDEHIEDIDNLQEEDCDIDGVTWSSSSPGA